MHHHAFQTLARELLWLLIRSRELLAADAARIVAYRVLRLPPVIRFACPDAPRYHALLDPITREARAARLADAFLHLLQGEERDNWVGLDAAPRILVEHATSAKASAEPLYDLDALALEPPRAHAASRRPGEALLRIRADEGEILFAGGEGLRTFGGERGPRVTLYEQLEEGLEVAYALCNAPVEVSRADGLERRHPAHTPIPITHDATLRARTPRLKFWRRDLELRIEVLGEVRAKRPALSLVNGRAALRWERNREPELTIDDAGEALLALNAGHFDHVRVRTLADRAASVIWFDERALDLPRGEAVPFQGAHLRGIHLERSHHFDARVDGHADTEPPRVFEIHGVLPPSDDTDEEGHVLFGFEADHAVVFQDGLLLDEPPRGGRPLGLPVRSRAHVGPLLRVAFDGCEGCKLLPLSDALVCDEPGITLTPERWTWVTASVSLRVPGVTFRLELFDRPRVVFDEPRPVARLSADPEARWRVAGWSLKPLPEGLQVRGHGRAQLRVDQRDVAAPEVLAAAPVHRIEVGHGRYRLVVAPEDSS